MGAGLIQLSAYGSQDIYLTGNPQITFFKIVYRRHTNFSMEIAEQSISGTPSNGGISDIKISRIGDLLTKIYITSTSDTDDITNGSAILSQADLEIGGQLIDRQKVEWMNIYNELTIPRSKSLAFKYMIGDHGHNGETTVDGVRMIQVPLNFWFCKSPGLALPLIALQYHEVNLKINWGSPSGNMVAHAKVYCDYIYLDIDERKRFAQVSHEYLIEQVQSQSMSGSGKERLNFNHPVKEIIWTSPNYNNVFGYHRAQLRFNGMPRTPFMESEYYQLRQPFDHHTEVPNQNTHIEFHTTPDFTEQTLQDFSSLNTETVDDSGPITSTQIATGKCCVAISSVELGGTDPVDPAATFSDGDPSLINPNQLALLMRNDDATNAGFVKENLGIEFQIKFNDNGGAAINNNAGSSHLHTITLNGVQVGSHSGTTLKRIDNTITAITIVENGFRGNIWNVNAFDEASGTVPSVTSGFIIDSIKAKATRGIVTGVTSKMEERINVYSFALKPEEHQPSGTCNFSRLDNVELEFSGGKNPDSTHNIYAVNYNVLRIMSGMGALAYNN